MRDEPRPTPPATKHSESQSGDRIPTRLSPPFLKEGGQGGRSVSLGIDVGSTTVKIVAVDAQGTRVWQRVEAADPRVEAQVERLLAMAGWRDGVPLVATGCGRALVRQATRQVTEITCHARGVFRELGHGGTLVDIGGQDSKVIRVDAGGGVADFCMNDKCAAGTGRFLENTARRLDVPLERMGDVALASEDEVPISSTCTVFAESEIVSLLAHGAAVETVVKGLHRALVQRLVAMVRTVGLAPPLMLSGGVARNRAVARLLEDETGESAMIPRDPQVMGAYGAALVALGLRAG